MDVSTVRVLDGVVEGPHGPVPVRRYIPESPLRAEPGESEPSSSVRVGDVTPVVWVHGGGFVRGGLDQPESDAVARALAAAGIPVTTVGYRLVRVWARAGRRNLFPVPLDDVVAVVRAVSDESRRAGGASNRAAGEPGQTGESGSFSAPTSAGGVILGGASAGACLSAGVVRRQVADGLPVPRGVFFAYGFFHATFPRRSPRLIARLRGRRRYMHHPVLLDAMNRVYAGSAQALRNPEAFAGSHDVGMFPPALFVDADRDSMRASGAAFARELRDAGVSVDYDVPADSSHAFLNRPNDPAFAPTIDRIVAWVRSL